MRNLKRALSLALASVMLLGMMVTGANALSFQDADEISNVTAATVLEELGIMVGDGTNFHPEQTVTRAEMAVIVCTILYGERLNVNQFVDGSKFTDVPEGHWANGYVNLANSLNIIVGYGDGTFGPNDPVTTAQATLMLTKALGWFRAGELVDNWTTDSMTIVTKGTQIGLFGDLKLANNEGLKRDNVAELTFNAITKAVPVMYNSTWDVYYTDSQNVLGGTKFDYRNTLGYENFSLAYDTGSDDFGRPTTRWGIGTIRNSGIVVDAQGNLLDGTTTLTESFLEVSKEADYTFTEKVTYKKLSDTIGRSNVRSYTWTINGGADKSGNSIDWTNDDDAIQATNNIVTGNGVLTQVYVREDANNSQKTTAQMFIVPYYVAQVDGDYNSSKGELRIVGLDDANALPTGTETTLSNDDFGNLASFHDEDYVLVTVAGKEVQSIELAEVITGSVDSYVSEKNVTVEGKQYKYTKNYRDNNNDGGYTLKNEYNVVLDKFGYVIFADGVGADEDYLFVLSAGKLGGASTDMEIEAVFTDGTKKNVTIHKDSEASASGNVDYTNEEVKSKWYKWELKGGKYVLTNFASAEVKGDPTSPITDGGVEVAKTGRSTVYYTKTLTVDANSGTVFIVDREGTISVYTGIRNVPDIKTKSGGSGVTVSAVMGDKGYADYVYISGDKTDFSTSGAAAGEYIFIVDAEHYATKLHSNGNDKVYVYEAVRNGVEEEIVSTDNSLEVGLHSDVSYDGDYVDSMSPVNGAADDDYKQYGLTKATFTYEGGVLSWGSNSVGLTSGCKVWTTDRDELKVSSGSALASDYGVNGSKITGNIYLVMDGEAAKEVYVDIGTAIAPVVPGTSKTEMQDALDKADANGTVTAKDPDLSGGLPTIKENQTLKLQGTMSGSNLKAEQGKVVLEDATIRGNESTGTLDATQVEDLTIGATEITGGYTLKVAAAKVNGVITVDAGATLEISGALTKEGSGKIEGVASETNPAKITVKDEGAAESLLQLANFFNTSNVKISSASDLTGKTFVWKEAWSEATRAANDHPAGWYEQGQGGDTPSTGEATKFAVSDVTETAIGGSANNGKFSITSDKSTAAAGETVTLTVTLTAAPSDGKQVVVTITEPENMSNVTFTAGGATTQKVTFTMPSKAVTVRATATESAAGAVDPGTTSVVTFTSAGNTITASGETKDVTVTAAKESSSVTIVAGLGANQTMKLKASVEGVTVSGENITVTVGDTEKTFTVVVEESGKTSIEYNFTVKKAAEGATKYNVTTTSLEGWAVTGINSDGYEKDAQVTITLTQETGADLAVNTEFTLTATGLEAYTAKCTTKGVAAVAEVKDTYAKATDVTDAETFATAKAKGNLCTSEDETTYTEVGADDEYDSNKTYYTKTPGTPAVAEEKGVVTITFDMPEKDVTITKIDQKVAAEP